MKSIFLQKGVNSRRLSSAILSFIFILLAAGMAEAQQAPQPAPETKSLEYFVGSWTVDSDLKPGPMGPGGKMTSTEKWDWMDGKYFIVAHTTMSGAMGNGSGLAVMGYNANQKKFTYNEFDSMGEAENATGTFDGTTWSWISDENMGGQAMKGRYTAKEVSATTYSFKFEMSQDGTNWTTVMDGTATKK
ncbi:MAG TPA: DUF1579 family protein [Terriglobales bacterium]|jgi:hypothetical protein